MADTEDNKNGSFLIVILLAVIAIASNLYERRFEILYNAAQVADSLMFTGWVVVLSLVYLRLKTTHKAMTKERQQLLRLKALEDRKQARLQDAERGDDDGNEGLGKPGPRPSSGAVGTEFAVLPPPPVQSREIEVGSRLSDGKVIKLSDQKRLGQVHIPGATGRGKTESVILPWMVQDFFRGKSVLLIDGKGDPDLVQRFCREADVFPESAGIFVFDPMNPKSCTINPLASGSPQQITDRIVSSFQFEDPYYKSVQADAVLTAVSLIHESGSEVTYIGIERALTDMDQLSELVNGSSDERIKVRGRSLIKQKEETRGQNLSGILTQLAPFTTGEIGRLVNGDETTPGRKVISLHRTLVENPNQRTATLILLPTLVYQDVGRALGKMILQELAYCVGMRASKAERTFPFIPVFLDEFSSFAYAGFEQILNKARSSGVALHLSHQSMGDLESVSPQFAKIVNTNSNVKCLLGLNDPDTAEFFARHLGTETTEKFTERVEEREGFFSKKEEKTGMKSMRETESYKVHPNILKSLTSGKGVLHVPTEYGSVTEEIQFHTVFDLKPELLGRVS